MSGVTHTWLLSFQYYFKSNLFEPYGQPQEQLSSWNSYLNGKNLLYLDQDTSMTQWLPLFKQTIQHIEPSAALYLFGSHARGDFVEESDWDILIVVDGYVSQERTNELLSIVFRFNVQYDVVISPIIKSQQDWYSSPQRFSRLFENIEREGISF